MINSTPVPDREERPDTGGTGSPPTTKAGLGSGENGPSTGTLPGSNPFELTIEIEPGSGVLRLAYRCSGVAVAAPEVESEQASEESEDLAGHPAQGHSHQAKNRADRPDNYPPVGTKLGLGADREGRAGEAL